MIKIKFETFAHRTEYTFWLRFYRMSFSITLGVDNEPTLGIGAHIGKDFFVWLNLIVIHLSVGFDFGSEWKYHFESDDKDLNA